MTTAISTPIGSSAREMAPATRDAGIDSVRGFLILCVVIGHTPWGYFTAQNPSLFGLSLYYFVTQVIWFFALPLFIGVSCLYLQPLSLRYAGKRALALLLPYVIYLCVQQAPALRGNPRWWLQMLAWGNFAKLISIIWFLPALYSCNIAAAAMVRSEKKNWFWIALAGLALLSLATGPSVASVHGQVPFGLDIALMMLPFAFGLRIVDRMYGRLSEIPRLPLLLFFLGGAASLFVLEPPKLTNPWQNKIDLAQYSIPSTPFNYVLWFLIAVAVFLLIRRKPWRVLSLLGSYSMPIYLIHYEVIKLALENKWPEKIGAGYLQALAIVCLAVTGPVVIGLLARKISPRVKYIGL
ncbi:MAG TPA: acyltransferase [Candidatus Didemnitutus sp.]|nr:acyltransferase [Candidatus Didemnitutus sp.]